MKKKVGSCFFKKKKKKKPKHIYSQMFCVFSSLTSNWNYVNSE